MPATLIDGKALAAQLRHALIPRITRLINGGKRPGLAVILVGDDAASAVYVRNKIKSCSELGMHSVFVALPATTTEAELLARLADLNADAAIHGILVQMPLPRQMKADRIVAAISPDKDVDGLHAENAGLTLMGRPRFRSCTPYGVMQMLSAIGCDPAGRHAVVVGRSNMVGKPMAMLLLAANATVTVCHSATKALDTFTREADILVVAAGRRGLIRADMVMPGAVVIDVGIHRTDSGQLVGDVDFAAVSHVAGAISPVPGGVGPMTIAMLMVNTVEAAERKLTTSSSLSL